MTGVWIYYTVILWKISIDKNVILNLTYLH